MVNLVDLSLLDERSFFRLLRSNLLTEDVAFTLFRTKKLDYGAIERKDEFLQLLTSEWQQHVMKQYVNMPSLHKDVFSPIFSFCEHVELDTLALVCKEMNGHVETFANNAIKKFKDAHPVDSTWRSRLEQLTKHVHHESAKHRHQLRYVTQLYMHSQEIDNCYQVLKLPGKSEMLVRKQDESIILWDPKTKEVVRVLEAPTPVEGLFLLCSQNFIVGIHHAYIMVWTIEGDFVYRIPVHTRGLTRGLFARRMLDDKFYYLQRENAPFTRSLAEIDISSGVTRHGTNLMERKFMFRVGELLPVRSWVLVLDEADGIYVVNRTDLSTTESHYPGDFRQLDSHGNTVVAAGSIDGIIEILDLKNDGSLDPLRSIDCSNPFCFMFDGFCIYLPRQEYPRRIRQDSVRVWEEHSRGVLIHSIDISSGSSMEIPPFPVWADPTFRWCVPLQVMTDGDEIFCTFRLDEIFCTFRLEEYRRHMCLVLVFPPKA